jgi:hypothetical protein
VLIAQIVGQHDVHCPLDQALGRLRQQPGPTISACCARTCVAEVAPPAADQRDRELRGVGVDPDAHPALVVGEIVDLRRVPSSLVSTLIAGSPV